MTRLVWPRTEFSRGVPATIFFSFFLSFFRSFFSFPRGGSSTDDVATNYPGKTSGTAEVILGILTRVSPSDQRKNIQGQFNPSLPFGI